MMNSREAKYFSSDDELLWGRVADGYGDPDEQWSGASDWSGGAGRPIQNLRGAS